MLLAQNGPVQQFPREDKVASTKEKAEGGEKRRPFRVKKRMMPSHSSFRWRERHARAYMCSVEEGGSSSATLLLDLGFS